MKKIVYLLACTLLGVMQVQAQQKGVTQFNLQYNYALPLGDFKSNYISNGSPRGFYGDIMYGISNKFALGGSVGHQDFYQKYDRAIYDIDKGQQVSAVISNSIQTLPIMVRGSFMPLGNKPSLVQPYISAGAGIAFVSYRQFLGEFSNSDNSARFTLQGDVGVSVPFTQTRNVGVKLGASYNYIPYNKDIVNNISSLGLHAGFFIKLQ
jgi:hypothetical protein